MSTATSVREEQVILEAQLIKDRRASAELSSTIAKNKKLLGKCFHTTNSYGSHVRRWPMYCRVLEITESGNFLVSQFQTDCYGDPSISLATVMWINERGWKMIPEKKYFNELTKCLRRAQDIGVGRAKKFDPEAG